MRVFLWLAPLLFVAGCFSPPYPPPGDPLAYGPDELLTKRFRVEQLQPLWGARRTYELVETETQRSWVPRYEWEVPINGTDWGVYCAGGGRDLWGLGGETAAEPVTYVTKVFRTPIQVGNTTLYALRRVVGIEEESGEARKEILLVDGRLRVHYALADGRALIRRLFNVRHSPQLHDESWRSHKDLKHVLVYSSAEGVAWNPETGTLARVPKGGKLVAIRRPKGDGRGMFPGTELDLVVWKVDGDATTRVFLSDLTPLGSEVREAEWSYESPTRLRKNMHVRNYRYMQFLCMRLRTDAGWSGLVWIGSHERFLAKRAETTGSLMGVNLASVGLETEADAKAACVRWIDDVVGRAAAIDRVEWEERERRRKQAERAEALAKAERAKARAPIEARLRDVFATTRIAVLRAQPEAPEKALQLCDALFAEALERLKGLAPQESPLVTELLQWRLHALAYLAKRRLKGPGWDGVPRLAEALNEAKILSHSPLANQEQAEEDLLIFKLCEAVTRSRRKFVSFKLWWEDFGPKSLAEHYADAQDRHRHRLLSMSGYRPTPARPSWFTQVGMFFTAAASATPAQRSRATRSILNNGGSVAVPNRTPTQSSFDRWAAQQDWNRRSQQLNEHYRGLRTRYQNKY